MHLIITILFTLIAASAQAINIQEVTSPKLGIKALLVESVSVPMVNIQVAFRTGSAFDPEDKGGVSYLTSALFDEGAADKNSTEFTDAIDSIGALYSVNSSMLNTTFSMRTLSTQTEQAFKLLGESITKPRFDDEAFLRMKAVVLSSIKSTKQNPGNIASLLLKENLYVNHPYGRPLKGTEENVKSLKVNDVKSFYAQNFNLKNMVVSVVGDITKEELLKYLDSTFMELSAGTTRNKIKTLATNVKPSVIKQAMPVPQSAIYLAHAGINREDPDYYAAYAMNYILGGGGFNSRLMGEIREKRGLTYGVYSYFEPLPLRGAFIVSVNTKNEDVEKTINLIKNEMKRMKLESVTDVEYEGAMSYLKGSFPLRLDSSSKVIGYLTTMQMENLGLDYLDKWASRIGAVTKADMQRTAKRLLRENEMIAVIVGGE